MSETGKMILGFVVGAAGWLMVMLIAGLWLSWNSLSDRVRKLEDEKDRLQWDTFYRRKAEIEGLTLWSYGVSESVDSTRTVTKGSK
jgi:hypothetical protein